MGLRAKSALALLLSLTLILGLSGIAGWRALGAVESNLGSAYARNFTQLNKQRILGPVQRELALSQRLADSEVTRRFLLDEKNLAKRDLFFAEAEGFRKAFEDKSYSVSSVASRGFYFNDSKLPLSVEPRYHVSPQKQSDGWFYRTIRDSQPFNINVDPDVHLKVTKVWFNVKVTDGKRAIGVAGTGMDLSSFLNRFIAAETEGVTPIVLDEKGAIQAHPRRELIDYNSVTDKGTGHSTIFQLLPEGDAARFTKMMGTSRSRPDESPTFWSEMDGRPQLFSMTYVPELQWFVVTAVDLKAARVVDRQLWLPILVVGSALILLLLASIVVAVDRLLLSPVLRLTQSVRTVAAGEYDLKLPPGGNDELGELTRAVQVMATQVREHTTGLEEKVMDRTRELVQLNERMAEANKKIGDSIQYASLIQNAILPERDLEQSLADNHFVIWRPRDVVGGDFYVCRSTEHGCVIGVWDCAGHGVPGAFMTMIAYAALNVALDSLGGADPAAVLSEVDQRVRTMLHTSPDSSQAATHMDAGLAYLDYKAGTVTFAGAKVSLYWCDGETIGEFKGDRWAISGKRVPAFANATRTLGVTETYYLTTDGFLDQAGGPKGYSFGFARFAELMQRHAGRPFEEQKEAFAAELDAYRGELAQRDDITLVSFRHKG